MTHHPKPQKTPFKTSVSTLFALNIYSPVQLADFSASWSDTVKKPAQQKPV
jgi:hypothetical protein